MKKKKKQKKEKLNKINTNIPRVFFRSIGIHPLIKPTENREISTIEKEIVKQFGQETADSFAQVFDDKANETAFDFCHKNLQLVKIWYGADINHLCLAAKALKDLDISPGLDILDIGGGAGHLAFWMVQIWKPTKITVADKYPEIGSRWAKDIKEARVEFIDTLLPGLERLPAKTYKVIILSRVLGFLDELNLPSNYKGYDRDEYLKSEEGTFLIKSLRVIARRINELLAGDGILLIVDSWSDVRAVLIGRAFETEGLHIDLDRFVPTNVAIEHSVVAFSKISKTPYLQQLPLWISVAIQFNNQPYDFTGSSAGTLKKFFEGGTTLEIFEYQNADDEVFIIFEVIDKEGILLLYKSVKDGVKQAWIYPSVIYKKVIEGVLEVIKEKVKIKGGKIVRHFDYVSLPN